MANSVLARANVAFEHPARTACLAQYLETLFQGVGAAPFPPEPVGMRVRRGFHDGVQTQQVQGLLGTIRHRGNAQGPPLAIAFRKVHAPQWLRTITVAPERVEGRGFGLRGVPDNAVHSRSTRTSIVDHS